LLAYVPGRLTYSYVADRIDLSLDLVLLLVVCTIPLYYLAVFVVQS
jgi:hypothetical protein